MKPAGPKDFYDKHLVQLISIDPTANQSIPIQNTDSLQDKVYIMI